MSRDRQAPSLGWPPSDPQDLKGFSSQALTPETPLFRIISKGRGPWWFGSTMRGRFDLPKPDGTCYLASDEVSALLEAISQSLIERLQEETGLEVVGIPRADELRILKPS